MVESKYKKPMRITLYVVLSMAFALLYSNTAHAFTLDTGSFEQFVAPSATAPVSNFIKDLGKRMFSGADTVKTHPSISDTKEVSIDPSLIVSVAKKAWALTAIVASKLGLTVEGVLRFIVNSSIWVLQGALHIADNLLSAALGE